MFTVRGIDDAAREWTMRFLNLHPEILAAKCFQFSRIPYTLLGDGWSRTADASRLREFGRRIACEAALRAQASVAAAKPSALWVGQVSGVNGHPASLPGMEVLRDGRDYVVNYTLEQLQYREGGSELREFLSYQNGDKWMMRVLNTAHNEPKKLEHDRGRLLCDPQWVAHAARKWRKHVSGYLSAMGAVADGKATGECLELKFEELQKDPTAHMARIAEYLRIDPTKTPSWTPGSHPFGESERDLGLAANWEVGRWRRYFTLEASRVFEREAGDELRYVAGPQPDGWRGDCAPVRWD